MSKVRFFIFITLYISAILSFFTLAFSQPLLNLLQPNHITEQWIIDQLSKGEVADLKQKFIEEKDCIISATFLEKLLTNTLDNVNIHRHGVQIANAIIKEPVDLINAEIPFDTILKDCRFESNVNLSNSIFCKNISFSGCSFTSGDFSAMKVNGAAFFNKVIFTDLADFRFANIEINFESCGSKFQEVIFASMNAGSAVFYNKAYDKTDFYETVDFRHANIQANLDLRKAEFKKEVDLGNIKVGSNVFLSETVFDGPVDFCYSEIGANLEAIGTKFSYSEFPTKFLYMKVGGNVLLNKAEYSGPAYFTQARINNNFIADEIKFIHTEEPAIFNGMKVEGVLSLEDAKFFGPANFGSIKVDQLQAENVIFKNSKQKADFESMKVGKNAIFNNVIFEGSANFMCAEITGNFHARGAAFKNHKLIANFNGMKVGGTAFLEKVVFEGPVNFMRAEITGNFQAREAKFNSTDEVMNFNSMKVGATYLEKAVFKSAVDFGHTEIAGNFHARGAAFKNHKLIANFNGMKVGGTAFLEKVVFEGPVNFGLVEITGNFQAREATFNSPDEAVNFNNMKVDITASFKKSIFEGGAEFGNAVITGNFEVQEAQFKNNKKVASFNGIKVGRHTFLNNAIFEGEADFTLAEITGGFNASYAKFNNTKFKAIFEGMKVGGPALFKKVVFKGPMSMENATFIDLTIQGSKESSFQLQSLNLSLTVIRRELRIEDLRIQDMIATSLRVMGPTYINQLTIEGKAKLDYSSFLSLDLSEVSWPLTKDSISLNGMTYDYISAGSKNDSWEKLKTLVNQSKYDVNVYKNLETFFRQYGYQDRANKIFLEQKNRERREVLHGLDKGWNFFLYYFIHHGKNPEWAFLWCFFIILLGTGFFHRSFMEPRKEEYASVGYNSFLYSLDLFLPFVDLQKEKYWTPKQGKWISWLWRPLHTLLGWVLIPIGLAAITGIIK